MSAICKNSILTNKHNKLTISFSILVYIDDTLWITNSKPNLELITQTATSFYQIANIQINPHKSVLITNTKKLSQLNLSTLLYNYNNLVHYLNFLDTSLL